MENNEEIYQFDTLNIVDYLNTRHTTVDIMEIESEMNTKKVLLKKIDEGLYEFFTQSSDSLLSLLDTYKQCLEILKRFKIEAKAHKEPENENIFSEELAKKFRLFSDDLKIFLTEERYFIASCVFNDQTLFCLLTNDLLFIGEKDKENLYKLKRSIPKLGVKMVRDQEKLKIVMDNGTLNLKADKNQVDDFYESFQDSSYVPGDSRTVNENTGIDQSLIDFYIETENYEAMSDYLQTEMKKSQDDEKILNILGKISSFNDNSIACLLKFVSDPLSLSKTFFINRFLQGLDEINQIQEFDPFLNDVFSLLQKFCKDLELFFKNNKLSQRALVLLMEECTVQALKYVKRRVFIRHKSLGFKDTVAAVTERLEFSNYNFKYLISEISDNPVKGTEKAIIKAKEAIAEEINNFLLD